MITEKQKNIIIDTIMPLRPLKIGIFGSYARGDNTSKSDIDILYTIKDDNAGLFALVRLQNTLEEKLNKKVDLVSEEYAHPLVKPFIMNDLKVIYSNES